MGSRDMTITAYNRTSIRPARDKVMSAGDISVSESQQKPKVGQQIKTLSARLEPFDTYWQAPEDVESGFDSFYAYYKANYLPYMPDDRAAKILVVSCGPGYFVNTLKQHGYTEVTGIDSDPEKIRFGTSRNLNCSAEEAFPFLLNSEESYDVIVPEQELNHLTLDEQIDFLQLCKRRLAPGGYVVVYGLNGANPLVGSETLAQNIDHFNTFTEYSLTQLLEITGFKKIKPFPLKLYVFWRNPLNYVGFIITTTYEMYCRIMFKIYGKNVRILSKKIAAIAFNGDEEV
jgi:2-polyprenyl-3-methyl-5-hydroxy-6-metoxy-1,4-benzoquinol methylase